MTISKNLARVLLAHKREYALSFEDLARKLNFPKSSTVSYCSGTSNPRSDTLESVAAALGVSIAEIVSDQPPWQERVETIIRMAQAVSGLKPERREEAVQLILALAALFAEENPS